MDDSVNSAYAQISKVAGTPCNEFVATALQHNGIPDFFGEKGAALTANDIADGLAAQKFAGWHPIGNASAQPNLDAAQRYASSGFNVVAAWKNTTQPSNDGTYHGHVCLIIPGEEERSDKLHWGENVPQTANLALHGSHNSRQVRMSYAFSAAINGQVFMYYHR